MRFTLSSSALNSQLQSLSKVINSKNSLAILDCFLFQLSEGKLNITASDSENVLHSSIVLDECDAEGTFAIPSKTILDAMRELPEQPLTFDVDPATYTCKVLYQNGMYSFAAQNAEEYPSEQGISESATQIVIDTQVLSSCISRALFATAQDELRPVMNGIYFDLTADALAIVASDGHKLVRNKNYAIKSDVPAAFILPKKPATLLKNILGREEGEVIIRFDERTAEIEYFGGSLTCRLIEGRYPNYNAVIPQDNPNQLTIDRKTLLSALRRVLPFASNSSQLIRFKLDNGKIQLRAEDIDFATSAQENLMCDYNGRPMSIGFKGSSLTEILNNLDCEEITLQLADPSRAGIIVPALQQENEDVLMLIMPMLLND